MITHRFGMLRILTLLLATLCASTALAAPSTEANVPLEIAFQAAKSLAEPFRDVTFDVVFTDPTGQAKTVPGYWVGDNQWKVRYASPTIKVSNSSSGKSGLWLYQMGEQQEFRKFAVSATPLAAGAAEVAQGLGGVKARNLN